MPSCAGAVKGTQTSPEVVVCVSPLNVHTKLSNAPEPPEQTGAETLKGVPMLMREGKTGVTAIGAKVPSQLTCWISKSAPLVVSFVSRSVATSCTSLHVCVTVMGTFCSPLKQTASLTISPPLMLIPRTFSLRFAAVLLLATHTTERDAMFSGFSKVAITPLRSSGGASPNPLFRALHALVKAFAHGASPFQFVPSVDASGNSKTFGFSTPKQNPPSKRRRITPRRSRFTHAPRTTAREPEQTHAPDATASP